MDFRIADTFTDSLARLTGDEQKAVKTTAFDLQMNPAQSGPELPQARQGAGQELLVGAGQPRHPAHRPQDRTAACCCATSTTTTRPTSGPSGAGSRRIRRRARRSSSRFASGSRRSWSRAGRRARLRRRAAPKPLLFERLGRRRTAGLRRARGVARRRAPRRRGQPADAGRSPAGRGGRGAAGAGDRRHAAAPRPRPCPEPIRSRIPTRSAASA